MHPHQSHSHAEIKCHCLFRMTSSLQSPAYHLKEVSLFTKKGQASQVNQTIASEIVGQNPTFSHRLNMGVMNVLKSVNIYEHPTDKINSKSNRESEGLVAAHVHVSGGVSLQVSILNPQHVHPVLHKLSWHAAPRDTA